LSSQLKTDEIVVPALQEAINDSINKNKIIFIHLMGNHHFYHSRYPESFEYFNHKTLNDLHKPFLNDAMRTTIDSYDNSIRYGDFVYNEILEQVKASDKPSFLLFFSDHGEEVYDFRKVSGHALTNVYPCQSRVPFVLWRSEAYRQEMPDLVIDTARAYSTEELIYAVSNLCGLKYEDYDATKSLFSKEYKKPARRLVGKEDYEDILKKPM
jgi:heptose-I-phosphate ethanolaminephosphotransferase